MYERWDTRYDYSGRKRKKKQPKGEVFTKYKPKPVFTSGPVSAQPFRRDAEVIYRSADDNGASVAARNEPLVYSGDKKLVGLATLHKSNMVPVFEEEGGTEKQYAKDLASMRR